MGESEGDVVGDIVVLTIDVTLFSLIQTNVIFPFAITFGQPIPIFSLQ